MARVGEKDVLGLNVAVEEVGFVDVVDGCKDLVGDCCNVVVWDFAGRLSTERLEISVGHQLEDEVDFAFVEDGLYAFDDVWMDQSSKSNYFWHVRHEGHGVAVILEDLYRHLHTGEKTKDAFVGR